MQLGLGTVQFGQAYGISNIHGKVSRAEAAEILLRAATDNIRILDTAASYGESERVLSSLNTGSFRIITKTISAKHGLASVVARARASAEKLKADTLLVHAAADLEHEGLWPALQSLKSEGIFRKIGISAYAADRPAHLAARYEPDVMQLPISLLDQRLVRDNTLATLKNIGVEVHARSIFLQGLLFLEQLPEKLAHVAGRLAVIREAIAELGVTPLEAALSFILQQTNVDVALVGVTSLAELGEIIAVAAKPVPDLGWASFAIEDEVALTPSLW